MPYDHNWTVQRRLTYVVNSGKSMQHHAHGKSSLTPESKLSVETQPKRHAKISAIYYIFYNILVIDLFWALYFVYYASACRDNTAFSEVCKTSTECLQYSITTLCHTWM